MCKQFLINIFSLVIRIRHDARKALRVLGAKCGCDAKTEAPVLMTLAKSLNLKVSGKF